METNGTYVIRHKDGGYLCHDRNNRWTRTPRFDHAEIFPYEKANNVLQNCIGPTLRACWCIVNTESILSVNIPIGMKSITEYDWEIIASEQHDFFSRVQQYGEECRRDLETVEMEICDINHYIEFFALDASKGYKAYRMLHDRLNRRRYLKDEITKSSCIMNGTAYDYSSGKVNRQISGFDNRRYSPRVMKELFGIDAAIA